MREWAHISSDSRTQSNSTSCVANRSILIGQGPAVLAAGTGLKLFDFLTGIFLLL